MPLNHIWSTIAVLRWIIGSVDLSNAATLEVYRNGVFVSSALCVGSSGNDIDELLEVPKS